jgi:hypothetical protein
VWTSSTWRSPAGERIRSFAIVTTEPNELCDRINDRYGRCAIGFGLFPPDVRAFKGHAAFHRVPER